jgi:hypothetical protein
MGVLINKILKELHNKSIIKKVLNENYQDENISQEEKNSIIEEYGWLKDEEEIGSNLIRPIEKQIYKTIKESKTKSTIKKLLREEFNELDWIKDVVTAKLAKNENWILVNDIDRESISEGHLTWVIVGVLVI